MNKRRVALLFIIVAAVFLFHISGVRGHITLKGIQESLYALSRFVESHYTFSVLLFAGTFVASVLTFMPIKVLLNLLGGYLFGPLLAALYLLPASLLGETIVFWGARYIFRDWVTKRFVAQAEKFNYEISQRGIWYIIILNLLPLSPTSGLSIIAGISSISVINFLWANALGLLPGTLLYTMLGSRLPHITSLNDFFTYEILIFILLAIIFFVIMPYVWFRRKIRWPLG